MNQLPANEVRLDDESVAMLLEEVSAMAASGRPLALGMVDLDQASLGRVGRAAKVIGRRIESGHAPEKAIASLSENYESPIRIAMETMIRTGSTEPIDETVRLIREEKQQRYETGLAAINPVLNVVVASVVLFFVMPWIWVAVSRTEKIKGSVAPTVTEICEAFAKDFGIASLATLLVVGGFAAAYFWLTQRASDRTDGPRAYAIFCRWLAMQLGGNSTPGAAIEVAARVVGPDFEESWQPSLQRISGGSRTSDALQLPATTPEPVKQCVVDLVAANRDHASIAMDLRQLSELYQHLFSDQRGWWAGWLPRVLSGVIIITVIAVLIRSIVTPLINVVTEVIR